MNDDEKQEYLKYRLESARKTFDAAKILAQHGFWNSAVNRLYYSLFYAVNALLVKNNIQTKTHSSLKTKLRLVNLIKDSEGYYRNYLTGVK